MFHVLDIILKEKKISPCSSAFIEWENPFRILRKWWIPPRKIYICQHSHRKKFAENFRSFISSFKYICWSQITLYFSELSRETELVETDWFLYVWISLHNHGAWHPYCKVCSWQAGDPVDLVVWVPVQFQFLPQFEDRKTEKKNAHLLSIFVLIRPSSDLLNPAHFGEGCLCSSVYRFRH